MIPGCFGPLLSFFFLMDFLIVYLLSFDRLIFLLMIGIFILFYLKNMDFVVLKRNMICCWVLFLKMDFTRVEMFFIPNYRQKNLLIVYLFPIASHLPNAFSWLISKAFHPWDFQFEKSFWKVDFLKLILYVQVQVVFSLRL